MTVGGKKMPLIMTLSESSLSSREDNSPAEQPKCQIKRQVYHKTSLQVDCSHKISLGNKSDLYTPNTGVFKKSSFLKTDP